MEVVDSAPVVSEESPSVSTTIDLGSQKWMQERMILLAHAGSIAYGTAIEGSDTDVRGIVIPGPELELSLTSGFSAYSSQTPEHDLQVWGLRHFMLLAAKANPNVLELLFTDDEAVLLRTAEGEMLSRNRELFLSKRLASACLGAVRQFSHRMDRHGWDPKTAMHQVRLLSVAIEVLSGQPWRVRRPELLPIRTGGVPREEVEAQIRDLMAGLSAAMEKSRLPDHPDMEILDLLYRELVTSSWDFRVRVPAPGWQAVEMTYHGHGSKILGRNLVGG